MKKITYGAPRLVDWVAQIKAGAATVRVHFIGGALTTYGVTPAEFTTSNPFIQKVIEQSSYYKEGRIIFMREIEIKDPIKPAKGEKSESAENPKPTKEEQIKETNTLVTEKDPSETYTELEKKPEDNAPGKDENGSLTKIEVSCLPDAQAYLQEQFNIASYKIRSCEAAQRAAAEHGIQFIGGKFDTLNGKPETEAENTEE